VVKDFIHVAGGIGKCTFREGEGVRINMDRARLVTESHRRTEGKPWPIRKAEALSRLCEEMPIYINPGELIVGDPNGAPDEIRWYPETSVWWMPEAVTSGGFSQMVNDVERKEIVEDICEYWKERATEARIKAALPEELKPIVLEPISSVTCAVWEESRGVPGYEYEALFQEGLEARIARAEAKLKDLEARVGELHPAEYLEKRNNWRAMAMCGRAILRYAQRHAELAREQAAEEEDEVRRKELEEMAAILARVPAQPPRTFQECLQFYWIIEVTGHYLAMCGNGCGVRIDQVWRPFFEADIEAGRITREKALELVECLFIKIQGLGSPLESPIFFTATSGFDVTYTANIAGSDGYGRDLSNELTVIAMEALANLHVNQPPIAIRYHRNISPEVVDRAIDLNRVGMGHPSWFNEDLLEKWGLMRGWSPEDAKKVQVGGCVLPHLSGKFVAATGLGNVGAFVSPKLLEEVLGLYEPPPVPGRGQIADPTTMESAGELLDAYCEKLLFYLEIAAISWNIGHQMLEEYLPDPCNSFLMEESLERGYDLKKLAKEGDTFPNLICFGAINTSDSLAAIETLIFEGRHYSMRQLLDALRANWKGYEEMRQDFLNAPKFGNDDEYADSWAVKFLTRIVETAKRVRDAWGCSFTFDGSTAAAYQVMGLACGATPDGRLALSPLADGSVSPMTGTDRYGPTAVLNSVGKLPYMYSQLLNQRFMPVVLEEENKELFAHYIREWYEKGTIGHIQFNVVDSEVLRDAQEHPERHANLQVRVAGYSAFWIDLPRETQDSIIARTEQGLGICR
jgi:pyruvate formate-lyase/glycerol dehydratase family glycyl radical enzyme